MKRLFLSSVIVAVFVYSWVRLNEIPLFVVGQPSSTGLLQHSKEAPFFNNLSATTHLPFKVTYKPLEEVGFKDTFQLQMLKDGLYDMVSLRFIQNSEIEPSLQGLDLVGLNPDFDTAQKVIAAYAGTVDGYLQEKYEAKLLGIWSFGPQELFCAKPIKRLEDIKGLKVRVASDNLALFISNLGGVPVFISFDETKDALAKGLVDCAVTSSASANFAGWCQYTQYYFPLAVHYGLNGYVISLRKWNALSKKEKAVLQDVFAEYIRDLWQFTLMLYVDMRLCNTGGECKNGNAYAMTLVEPSAHDIQLLRETTAKYVLPEWGEKCQKVHPDCLSKWQEKVGMYLK